MKKLLLVLVILFGAAYSIQAADLQNDAALAGVANTNAIFDISPGGSRLLGQLNVIHKTYEQLLDFGYKPHFVLAFRGAATPFVTSGNKYVDAKNLTIKKLVQKKIEELDELGATMELCAIAANAKKVEKEDLLPGIELVANGYISVIGYQSKGYNLVPIY